MSPNYSKSKKSSLTNVLFKSTKRCSLLVYSVTPVLTNAAGLLSDLTNLVVPSSVIPTQTVPAPTPTTLTQQSQEEGAAIQSLPDWFLHFYSVSDMDLFCHNNKTLSPNNWMVIQEKFQYILSHPDAAFTFINREEGLNPVLLSIMSEDMNVPTGSKTDLITNLESISYQNIMEFDYCGVGKLMIQLLSLLQSDTGDGVMISNMLYNNEKMTSPLLTLLLDIPWLGYSPKWPLFGIMAQMSIIMGAERGNDEVIDGLDNGDLMGFAQAMNVAIVSGNLPALKSLATSFLEAGPDAASYSPLGFLTCLFARAATADIPMETTTIEGSDSSSSTNNNNIQIDKIQIDKDFAQEEGRQLFHEAQQVFKRLVKSPAELGVTMGSKWPLWGMAYLASLKVGV